MFIVWLPPRALVRAEISTISHLWCTMHHNPRSPQPPPPKLVLSWCCGPTVAITKWRNTKDWLKRHSILPTQKQTKNGFHNTTKHPKNCLRIVFNIQEKLETVSVQNFTGGEGGDKASFWQCESGQLNAFDSEAFHAPNLMHYSYPASNDCFASNGCTFDVINRRTLLIWHSEGL